MLLVRLLLRYDKNSFSSLATRTNAAYVILHLGYSSNTKPALNIQIANGAALELGALEAAQQEAQAAAEAVAAAPEKEEEIMRVSPSPPSCCAAGVTLCRSQVIVNEQSHFADHKLLSMSSHPRPEPRGVSFLRICQVAQDLKCTASTSALQRSLVL